MASDTVRRRKPPALEDEDSSDLNSRLLVGSVVTPVSFQPTPEVRVELQDNSSTGSEDVSKSTSSGSGPQLSYGGLSAAPSIAASAPQCRDAAAEDTTDTEASSESMLRSLSDSGPVASEVPVEAFPSLKDAVLRQLGLLNTPDSPLSNCDALPEQDIENKFVAMSLAMRVDKDTLKSRVEIQQRQRDHAERAVTQEAENLQAALHKLNYLCKDSESIEILTNIKNEANALLKAVERISSSSETLGAVRQECRVSKAFDVVLAHAEKLKRMYEKEHSELEETKKVLSENNLTNRESREETQGSMLRYRAVHSMSTGGIKGSKRRASIAAMTRPIGSTSSLDSSRSSLNSFGEGSSSRVNVLRLTTITRRPSLAPSTSSSPGDPFSPAWDLTDHSDISEPFNSGAMDNITEVGESRPDSEADKKILRQEENNNQRRASTDKPVDRRISQHEMENGENHEEVPLPLLGEIHNPMEENESLLHLNIQFGPAIQTLREWWYGSLHDAMEGFVERMWPLNAAQAIRMFRKFVVGLLLLAAALCLASILVPVGAQTTHSISSSWLSWGEIVEPLATILYIRPSSS